MKIVATVAITAAGLAAAFALTLAPTADAWNINSLPAGYGVAVYQTTCHTATDPCVNGDGSVCNHYTITAAGVPQFAEADCVNPTFQQDVDNYVNATICTVNSPAGQAAGVCAAPTTTTVAATITSSTTPAVTSSSTAAPVAASPTTSSATAAPTQTVTVTQTVTQVIYVPTPVDTASASALTVTAGAPQPVVALAVRSAGMNALYDLVAQ